MRSIRVERTGIATTSKGFLDKAFYHNRPHPDQKGQELEPEATLHIESLFVALKVHRTVKALIALQPRLNANSTIVLDGTGIHDDLLSDVLFLNPTQCLHFILASNTRGAFVKDPYRIIPTGMGSIEFSIAPGVQGRDYETGLKDKILPSQNRRLRL